MDKKQVTQAMQKVLENKENKKFTQSVEAIFNFRGVDFTKPENRINMDINLPKGKGKEVKVIAFAEGAIAVEAKKEGIVDVFDLAKIEDLKKNKKELKKLCSQVEFIAAPQMMVEVGKNLGQVLGSRGKLPKPIVGPVKNAIENARSRVRITTRGKYLPTVQCTIGTEKMSEAELIENFDSVYDKLKNKVGESAITKVYLKLTMGPAIKIGSVENK